MSMLGAVLAFAGLVDVASDTPAAPLPRIVVTAAGPGPSASLPAVVDVVDARDLARARPRIDVSEALARVPGLSVRNRYNYAQDLQIVSRGFGARATFGVRGIELIVNGIPASGADGQGQLAHAALANAQRIEVLRGPLAALYGNAAGGVIQVFGDPRAQPPGIGLSGANAPLGWRANATARVAGERAALAVDASRFDYDGFRPHSAARRDVVDALATGALGDWDWSATLNALDAPDSDDPLGLTRADFDANPDSTAAVALAFDTRKSVRQRQLGAALAGTMGPYEIRTSAYAGTRDVEQFLAIPAAAQTNPLHSGGVVSFARDLGGAGLRVQRTFGAWRATAGVDVDAQREQRLGFENFVGAQLGVRGALRRDEIDRVRATDALVQLDWNPGGAWSATIGARATRVRFASDDRYVRTGNPDDSGTLDFRAVSPVAGVVWRPTAETRIHGAFGRGIETPTLNELIYRPDGASGLNTALDAARTNQHELGIEHGFGASVNARAVAFDARTRDEIAIARNQGGRTSFRNAGRARRRGVELGLDVALAKSLALDVAATFLDARFVDGFATCAATPCATPTVPVAPGNRIPGVPRRQVHAELRWTPGDAMELGVEALHVGPVATDDLNRERAAAWTTLDAHASRRLALGPSSMRAWVRVANLTDRRYAGSVIVNEANQRYFEPAPGRTVWVGLDVDW